MDYDDLGSAAGPAGRLGRWSAETIRDPLLIEMLFCPLMFYGAAAEHDMDFVQFSILFRSIFFEGLARPMAGIRLILKHLVRKFRELGGELRLRAGVSRLATAAGEVRAVQLDDGQELAAPRRRFVGRLGRNDADVRRCGYARRKRPAGQLSFFETVSALNVPPRELGCKQTVVFFNDSEKFHWQKPDELVDVRSGVICSPNNFLYDEPAEEGHDPDHGPGQFRPLAEPDARKTIARPRQTWYDRLTRRPCGFCPISAGR